MAQSWPSGVNRKFYGLSTGVEKNTKEIEFESGKKRTYLLNSTPRKTFRVSLSLESKAEETAFWGWYENDILSGSLSFVLPDFIALDHDTEYKLTSTPTTEGQYPKKLTLEMEEV